MMTRPYHETLESVPATICLFLYMCSYMWAVGKNASIRITEFQLKPHILYSYISSNTRMRKCKQRTANIIVYNSEMLWLRYGYV